MKAAEATEPQRMNALYWTSWHIVRWIVRCYFRYRILHPERIPAVGPVIIASNHVSFGDPPLIGCAVHRPINFLARSTLFNQPLFSWLIRKLGAMPVDRDGGGGAGLKATLDQLQRGCGIVVFPEGTRSVDGSIQRAQPGIGLTVIKSEAPVVPIRLFGLYEAWGRNYLLPRPRPVAIVFGEPMTFATLRTEAKTCDRPRLKEIYRQVADEIMTAIERLSVDG